MKHVTGSLQAASRIELFRQSWMPEGEPRAALAVVHGYGEHGGRYALLAKGLVPRGSAVHVIDLRGHGRSPGRRGHIERFDDYVGDSRAFVAAVRAEHPNCPVFLLGHSMGGLIAALHAEGGDSHLDGVILSSPFIRIALPISSAKVAGVRLLSRLLPTCGVGNTLPAADLSHDLDVVRSYETDELNHHAATARWGSEMLLAQSAALAGASRLRLPLLLQYGGADAIADPSAAELLFASVGAADKTSHRYDGYYHEIFNETGRETVYDDLRTWLGQHGTADESSRAPGGPDRRVGD